MRLIKFVIKSFYHFIQAVFVYIFFFIGKLIGLKLSRKIFSFFFLLVGPIFKSRKIIEKNLNYFLKDIDDKQKNIIISGMWKNYGMTFIEYIYLNRFYKKNSHISLEGSEIISEIIKEQQQCFIAQLELAKSLNCSVVIHSRNSFDDCVKFIDRSGVDWQKVVFHCFSEGISEVTKLNQRKGRASFTGNVTYSKNPKMVEVIKAQGIDLLMLETDSPYLSPEPNRRSINEPYRINKYEGFGCICFFIKTEEKNKHH